MVLISRLIHSSLGDGVNVGFLDIWVRMLGQAGECYEFRHQGGCQELPPLKFVN